MEGDKGCLLMGWVSKLLRAAMKKKKTDDTALLITIITYKYKLSEQEVFRHR